METFQNRPRYIKMTTEIRCVPKIVFAGGYAGSTDHPVHWHDNAWELIYLREGWIGEIVGQAVIDLEPGMFMVHPPGARHGDLASSDYFLFHVLLTSEHELSWPQFGRDQEGSPIGSLLEMVVNQWHNGLVHREAFLRHSAQLLDILMKQASVLTEEDSVPVRVVAKARGIFRRNFRDPLRMGELATELGISRSTLYAYFHQVLGRTPQDVLGDIRLKHALFLLRHSQMPVGEVAIGSGFCSASHLGRNLQKEYKRTAREIRDAGIKPGKR